MRTTINIDDHVLATARTEARSLGLTLGEYVERALRHEDAAATHPASDPELPVFRARFKVPIGEMTNREIYELLDEGVPLDKRR